MATIDLINYPLSISTTVEPDWGIVQDFADDGKMHRRELFGAQYFIINANWDLIDLAGRNIIEGMLRRNRMEIFEFDFDGHRYSAELVSPPARKYVSPTLYGISATFRGTRGDPIMSNIISATSRTIADGGITAPIYSVFGQMRITVRPGSGATVRVFKSSSPESDVQADYAAGKLSYANFNAGTLSTLDSGWFEWATGPTTVAATEGVEDGDKWSAVVAISTGGSAVLEVIE